MGSHAYIQSVLWFDQDEEAQFLRRLGRTLALSLVAHLVIVLVVTVLRLPQHGERPLAAVEVSLVSLSLPTPVKQPELPKPVIPPQMPEPKPAPAPMVKAAAPEPMPKAAAPAAATATGRVTRDILRDLQLPPDAPKFGELAPAKYVGRPQQEAKVKVPDFPRIPDPIQEPVAKVPQRSTISDDVSRELEEELKKITQFTPAAKLEIPKEVKTTDQPVKPVPQPEAKLSTMKTPETTLKISGSSGSNPYWARIQAIISSNWEPPPIDVSGQTYAVTIRFRLQRDGMIKDVVIQKTSGNSYYDMAGQRAVLRPRQFPVFPSDMTEGYKDIEMVFRVGEQAG